MFFRMQPVLKILVQTCLFDGKVTSEVLPQLEVVAPILRECALVLPLGYDRDREAV
jgi:hypothetical protein